MRLGEDQPRRGTLWLRPIVVGAFLLGGTAAASAAFTDWPANLVRACRHLVARPSVTSPALPETASRRRPLAALEHHEDAVMDEVGPVPEEPSTPTPVPRRTIPTRSRTHIDMGPAEDPALVVEATRALRVARDPRRARVLAARYLHEHAGGALAEEAQAIVVEAALAHHDPDASTQAARYLSLYPHGSFRAAAERALSSR